MPTFPIELFNFMGYKIEHFLRHCFVFLLHLFVLKNVRNYYCSHYYAFALVDCGDPGTLVNGSRSFKDTLEGSIVIYTCNDGFELVGNVTQICELTLDGPFWSFTRPRCKRMVITIFINKCIHSNCYSYFLWRPWCT